MTDCISLDEVRQNIDRIDREIVRLISQRSNYVRQASRFKKTREDVEAPKRVEEVISRVRTLAEKEALDPDIAEQIYRMMIKCFIDYELREYRK